MTGLPASKIALLFVWWFTNALNIHAVLAKSGTHSSARKGV